MNIPDYLQIIKIMAISEGVWNNFQEIMPMA